jgi:hypothetical protein
MRTLEKIGQQRFGHGVSYTWAVMPSGRVYQGHSPDRQGAHTRGRNTIGRAIVLVGNYNVTPVNDDMQLAVADLLNHAKERGWVKRARLNGGHRDAPGAQTACPGVHGIAAIPRINDLADNGVPSPPFPAGAHELPQLDPGDTGPAVLHLQQFLRRYVPSYAGDLVADGVYGPRTEAVVAEYQRRVGLPVVGRVGPRTNTVLWQAGYRG